MQRGDHDPKVTLQPVRNGHHIRITHDSPVFAVSRRFGMPEYLFNDSHVHLTNYVQEGPDITDYLA